VDFKTAAASTERLARQDGDVDIICAEEAATVQVVEAPEAEQALASGRQASCRRCWQTSNSYQGFKPLASN